MREVTSDSRHGHAGDESASGTASDSRSHRVEGAGGISIHVREWPGPDPPVLLLHGFENSSIVWSGVAPILAQHRRTLAMDLRGHGRSEWSPGGRYRADDFVSDLSSLADQLADEELSLVGHSLGGSIALHFTAQFPERVRDLVLVDFGPEQKPTGTRIIRQDSLAEPRTFATVAEFVNVLAHRYPMVAGDTIHEIAREELCRTTDGRFERRSDPCLKIAILGNGPATPSQRARKDRRFWELLAQVSCPTLVARGLGSAMLRQQTAERMAQEVLRRGRLAVVGRAGHSVMLDNPLELATVLVSFLADPGFLAGPGRGPRSAERREAFTDALRDSASESEGRHAHDRRGESS